MIFTDAKEFGQIIKKKRKEVNFTQGFVSEMSGLSISFIADLENGKSTIELGKAIFLANLLGLDCLVKSRGER